MTDTPTHPIHRITGRTIAAVALDGETGMLDLAFEDGSHLETYIDISHGVDLYEKED